MVFDMPLCKEMRPGKVAFLFKSLECEFLFKRFIQAFCLGVERFMIDKNNSIVRIKDKRLTIVFSIHYEVYNYRCLCLS